MQNSSIKPKNSITPKNYRLPVKNSFITYYTLYIYIYIRISIPWTALMRRGYFHCSHRSVKHFIEILRVAREKDIKRGISPIPTMRRKAFPIKYYGNILHTTVRFQYLSPPKCEDSFLCKHVERQRVDSFLIDDDKWFSFLADLPFELDHLHHLFICQ